MESIYTSEIMLYEHMLIHTNPHFNTFEYIFILPPKYLSVQEV